MRLPNFCKFLFMPFLLVLPLMGEQVVETGDTQIWQSRPGWVSNSARHFSVEVIDGIRFTIDEIGMGMKWVYYPQDDINIEDTGYVSFMYRARSIPVWNEYALSLGRGAASPVYLTELIDDGCWHLAWASVDGISSVDAVNLHLQVDRSGGFMEIKDLKFTSAKPARLLDKEIDILSGLEDSAGYEFLPIMGSIASGDWFTRAGYESGFPSEEVTVSGIPFKLSGNPVKHMETGVENTGQIEWRHNFKSECLYLLLGGYFNGDETPSIGYRQRNKTSMPDQLAVVIAYQDGSEDFLFPARVESGVHCISSGLGAYYVNLSDNKQVSKIKFTDNIRNGSLAVFAMTAGKSIELPAQGKPNNFITPRPKIRSGSMRQVCGSIDIRYDPDGRLYSIINRDLAAQWLKEPAYIFETDTAGKDLEGSIKVNELEDGQVGVSLTLSNKTSKDVKFSVKFPVLSGLNPGGSSSALSYFFPGRTNLISNENTYVTSDYSGYFPFQFVDAWHSESGGVYINANDSSNKKKRFWLDKDTDIEIGCEYQELLLKPGQTITLPQATIAVHNGDWHESLEGYKKSLSKWYRPAVSRKQWFREVFNFREQFLHYSWPVPTGAFDKDTKELVLTDMVETDIQAFGGVDYLHVFDWTWTPEHGRVGDYVPWEYLGGHEQFASEIAKLQQMGIPVGLYFEGYLASPKSAVGIEHGLEWRMLDANQKRYTKYGDKFHMCPVQKDWQNHLISRVVGTSELLNADGYYLDQFGFSKQYRCFNRDHGHEIPTDSVLTEMEVTKRLRCQSPLSKESVIYTEAVPTDVTSQYQDGSFTTTVRQMRFHGRYGCASLARFVIPDFKIFEILVVDKPTHDDFEGIKLVFYNGQGLWLMGGAHQWYSPEVRELIKKTHSILRKYRDAFTTDNPVPLVETLRSDVSANYFPSETEQVWTFFNFGFEHIKAPVIEVEHLPGSTYYDCWNGRPLEPEIREGKAVLTLGIRPRDAGCIVRKQK
ncbi:hypothetical protein SMSP2_01405 [Limihaloglobus sulfuriphilus]|uniref:DUF6259 domain-containing protein n=1 Tax=Limihaloglobus sulfuriphilus TaxID=1851148 RepID=A0A1Q2MEB1_9BACT|nr:DUF6259 domain-containing protein [Limihaloglobus sulfuriphilus]AQQ71041.1 hypothetical protein SMSP2_01405 [Limihaloglobus sulfuriphilus]